MFERQQLVCSLGAAVVMTDPEHDFSSLESLASGRQSPLPAARQPQHFGEAVRFLLSGTACLRAGSYG